MKSKLYNIYIICINRNQINAYRWSQSIIITPKLKLKYTLDGLYLAASDSSRWLMIYGSKKIPITGKILKCVSGITLGLKNLYFLNVFPCSLAPSFPAFPISASH